MRVPDDHVLEIHVGVVNELFNAIDPAPFLERDLDPRVEAFIVGWAEELRTAGAMTLVVRLGQPVAPDSHVVIRDAVSRFFTERARVSRRRLRLLLRRGRISLLIGLACLAASIFLGDIVVTGLPGWGAGPLVRESLLIGGWVAMWRPLEIFLYDWWPIRGEALLFDRLRAMTVRVAPEAGTP
jgi:hypothetical protein